MGCNSLSQNHLLTIYQLLPTWLTFSFSFRDSAFFSCCAFDTVITAVVAGTVVGCAPGAALGTTLGAAVGCSLGISLTSYLPGANVISASVTFVNYASSCSSSSDTLRYSIFSARPMTLPSFLCKIVSSTSFISVIV